MPSSSIRHPSRSNAEAGHAQVVGHAVADAQLAAGAGRQRDEAADLDVVRAEHVVGAAQLLLPVHDHQVGADALDARAHLHQEAGEVLHVGLAGGVVDHGRARRERGGHQSVLGGHHRGLVHEEVARVQAVRRAQVEERAVGAHLRTEGAEGIDVRVEPAAADHVAARGRHVGPAEAGEQRAGEQERGADALGPGAVHLGVGDLVRLQRERVLVAPLRLHPEPLEEMDHRLHVADARHVAQHHLLARQERGSERGQGRVLVAGGNECPRQGRSALDDELLHARIRPGTGIERPRKGIEGHPPSGSGAAPDTLPAHGPADP